MRDLECLQSAVRSPSKRRASQSDTATDLHPPTATGQGVTCIRALPVHLVTRWGGFSTRRGGADDGDELARCSDEGSRLLHRSQGPLQGLHDLPSPLLTRRAIAPFKLLLAQDDSRRTWPAIAPLRAAARLDADAAAHTHITRRHHIQRITREQQEGESAECAERDGTTGECKCERRRELGTGRTAGRPGGGACRGAEQE